MASSIRLSKTWARTCLGKPARCSVVPFLHEPFSASYIFLSHHNCLLSATCINQSPLHIVPTTAFLALLFLHQPTPHSSPSFLSDRTISKPLRRLTTHFTHTQIQTHASYPSFENAVIYIIIIIITHTPFIQRAAFGFAKSFYTYTSYIPYIPIQSHL